MADTTSYKVNWNQIQTILAILMAIGVFAGFWMVRERALWNAVDQMNKLQAIENRLYEIDKRLSLIESR